MRGPQKNHSLLDNPQGWFNRRGEWFDSVLSTRIRLSMNLVDHHFPPAMNELEREGLCSLLKTFFYENPYFIGGKSLSMRELSQGEKSILSERKILSPRLAKEVVGHILLSQDESLSMLFGLDDHIQIVGLSNGFSLDKTYREILSLEKEAEDNFSIARNEEGGFLTSRVTESGTGLRASVLMQLPGLSITEDINPILLALMDMGLSIRGFLDDDDLSTGGLYQIYNTGKAGFVQGEQILNSLSEAVKILSEKEEKSCQTINRGHFPHVEDRVYRSLGTLRYCRLLSAQEALKHLVIMRQGISLGWISEISLEAISSLLLYIGDAHISTLLSKEGQEQTEERGNERRARLVREVLAGGKTYFGV